MIIYNEDDQGGAERFANEHAQFLAATGDDDGTLPAVKVAGCLVFAYVSDGKLRVSVDLDDAAEWWGDTDAIPMEIAVQGSTVFAGDDKGVTSPHPCDGEVGPDGICDRCEQAITAQAQAREQAGSNSALLDAREARRPYEVQELNEGQFWALMESDEGQSEVLGPYASRAEADLAGLQERSEDGTALLCDECYEAGNKGLLAECQDDCSLDLDHDGECGPRYSKRSQQMTCDRCGVTGRLTREDVTNLDFS